MQLPNWNEFRIFICNPLSTLPYEFAGLRRLPEGQIEKFLKWRQQFIAHGPIVYNLLLYFIKNHHETAFERAKASLKIEVMTKAGWPAGIP